MKYLALTALLLASAFSHIASAQSDYVGTWSIVGTIGDNKFDNIHLDINEGSRYLAVNGALRAGNAAMPATGTCMFLTSGNIFCNLTVGGANFTVEITQSLNGTIKKIDAATSQVWESAAIQLISLQ